MNEAVTGPALAPVPFSLRTPYPALFPVTATAPTPVSVPVPVAAVIY
jgi:hypothetical protein